MRIFKRFRKNKQKKHVFSKNETHVFSAFFVLFFECGFNF